MQLSADNKAILKLMVFFVPLAVATIIFSEWLVYGQDNDPSRTLPKPALVGLPTPSLAGLPTPVLSGAVPASAHAVIPYPSTTACDPNIGVGYQCNPSSLGFALPTPSVNPGPAGLLASASNGSSAIPTSFGSYPLGNGLIGGPLLGNGQAAKQVMATRRSTVEQGPHSQANQAANDYYAMAQATYNNELQSFWSANPNGWGGVYARIDGACPLTNATTAMAAQWAANKWGINPKLLYAEAVQEGDFDMMSLGDNGRSSGVWQVADRGSGHAFPGFSGAGANLARENTCFNADFYAGHLYAAFQGWTNEGATKGDIGASIQSWFQGTVSGAGSYTSEVYGHLSSQDWIPKYYGGLPVNIANVPIGNGVAN